VLLEYVIIFAGEKSGLAGRKILLVIEFYISALLLKTCRKNKKSGECIEIRNLK